MNYFEIISTLIDLLIAAAGLIIAVIALKNEHRKRREEQGKNIILCELVSKIKDASLSKEYIDGLSKMKVFSEEDIYFGANQYIGLFNMYKSDYQSIYELYKGLLKFESEFSFSYGFGRYIDAIREFRDSTKSYNERIIEQGDYLEEDIRKEDWGNCIVYCGHLDKVLKEQVLERQKLEKFLIELRLKFDLSE